MEMTLENLLAEGQLNHADFLARVDILGALGRTVLISKFGEYYRLAAYLSRYTNKRIGLVMGVPSLMEIFDEKYYLNLEGGILEALGRMFKSGLKLYVYPMIDEETGELVTAKKIEVAPNLRSLFTYLIDNDFIEEIDRLQSGLSADSSAGRAAKIAIRRSRLGENGAARSGRDHQERATFSATGRRRSEIVRAFRLIRAQGTAAATESADRKEGSSTAVGTVPATGSHSIMAKRSNSVIGIDLGKHVLQGRGPAAEKRRSFCPDQLRVARSSG